MSKPQDIVRSRPLPDGSAPSTVTVQQDAAGRWLVSPLCDDPTTKPLPAADQAVEAKDDGSNRATARRKVARDPCPDHRRARERS
ncbi:hypothetical protein GCM10023335_75330 [Streptomyces siamensis]|uniref:Uncharacterized protein n=1 Tax=Streptomyces siamensis TaxID=1274986 RepID=A0ABP9JKV5_9ACTN